MIRLNHSNLPFQKDTVFFIRINNFFYKIEQTDNLPVNTIELNSAQRENHSVILGGTIIATLYSNKETNICDMVECFTIGSLTIDLSAIRPLASVQTDDLQSIFFQLFEQHPLEKNQLFYVKIDQTPVKCRILQVTIDDTLRDKPHHGHNKLNTPSTQADNRNFSKNIGSNDPQRNNFNETKNQKNIRKIRMGVMANATRLDFVSRDIHLVHDTNMLLENFNFFSLGIGGLKKEFSTIFRRAFLSRVYDAELIARLKIDHVRGMILYGPPGTGKTLIARQIGKLLNAKDPKVVNGPEILNKYVGQSEENIRDLFKDAEMDQKNGNLSNLHIIIFDEIDAICKKRNSSNNFTDQIVNQLLSKIDGVNSLNNILIIGMTNRIDLLDEALLRPGRFEIHIEIGLPSLLDRKEILEIHTKEIRQNDVIKNVDLHKIATLTSNYTGAELAAVVKSAVSYALERAVSSKVLEKQKWDDSSSEEHFRSNTGRISKNTPYSRATGKKSLPESSDARKTPYTHSENESKDAHSEKSNYNEDNGQLHITMDDFLKAISEIKPAFGLNDNDFSLYTSRKYYFLPQFRHQITLINNKIESLWKTEYYLTSNYLIFGERGTGKTALAARAVLESVQGLNKISSNKKWLKRNGQRGKSEEILNHYSDPFNENIAEKEIDQQKKYDDISLRDKNVHETSFSGDQLENEQKKDFTPKKHKNFDNNADDKSKKSNDSDYLEENNNFYIKIISPNELIGFSDPEKVLFIKDTFLNAYKSDKSIIILDSLECLIDYVPIGPRFSNLVLQTIKTFLRLESKKKCFIIGTCTDVEVLRELDLLSVFDTIGRIDKLQKSDLIDLHNMIGTKNEPLKEMLSEQITQMGDEKVTIREVLGALESRN